MPTDYSSMLRDLTSGTLAPEGFSHADHVGVAYEALSRSDFFDAAAQIATGLRTLAHRAGVPGKFNATITWAFLSLIAERMARTGHRDAADFLRRNPDLTDRGALRLPYSAERLASDLARSVALLPDQPTTVAGASDPCGRQ